MTASAEIKKITIERYRGLQSLQWRPKKGVNVILGGGDLGKSTILDAVALLLSATNSAIISEADFWRRDNSTEFQIEAVVAFTDLSEISTQTHFAWPWSWDGKQAVQPATSAEGVNEPPQHPVYRLRVRGTAEFELVWEILQPDGTADHLSVGIRRHIGLVRLGTEDRNDRDLRLVFGSALDRLVSDNGLRSRIGKEVADLDLDRAIGEKGKLALDALDKRLAGESLPSGLKLGITTSQGLTLGSLIGLLADKDGIDLPLTSWGAGTRRMAALEIAASSGKQASVTVIDELERGLEPYRLRKLIADLSKGAGQSFVTTHSPVTLWEATAANLWYLDGAGKIGELSGDVIAAQQRRDPLMFLVKLAVIGEGITEVGFLKHILNKAFTTDLRDHGVRVCDGGGNDSTRTLLEAFSDAGLLVAALADDENVATGRWKKLKEKLGDNLLQWQSGCTEEVVIHAVADDKIPELLKDADGEFDGDRLRTLADRLKIKEKDLSSIEAELKKQKRTLRHVVIAAATGCKDDAPSKEEGKEWGKHGRKWFKSAEGGIELAIKMQQLGAWPKLRPTILPLVNAILSAAGQRTVTDVTL